MAMEEQDRIDIIATLHNRFRKPAEEIISQMEEMEDQAGETGESLDEMQESLDKDSSAARRSSKALEENTKVRKRSGEAVDENIKSVTKSTRSLNDQTRALRDGLAPARRHAQALAVGAQNASQMADSISAGIEMYDDSSEAVVKHTRAITDHTKKTKRARDEFGRFTKAVKDSTEALEESTEAIDDNTESTEKSTDSKRKDRDEWSKWDKKIRKVTANFGKRFRPIGAFYQNYFKVLGAFRALLFSDIGVLIPQVITAIVALGAAANASLAPLGRLAGTLGQVVPLLLAIQQFKAVLGFAIGGVGDALKVLNDANATAEETAAAMKEAGENTWAMAKYVQTLQDRFGDLKREVRETLLDGMVPALDELVEIYLPLLQDKLTDTAKIMNGEFKEGFEVFKTAEKQETITRVLDRGAVASGLFVDIMFSLLDVVLELADAAGPAFIETLEAIDGLLDDFAGWIRDNKDGLTDFFNRSNDTAGNFLKGIGFILTGLSGIAEAAKPLEDFLYGGLLDRLEGWSERMNDPEQQEIMRENYEKMIPNLEAIGNLIGSIIDGAKEIATSEYFAPLVNDLADNGIPMMVEMFKALDETVGPPLLRISEAINDIDPDVLTTMLAPLGDMLGGLAWVLERVVPLFSALPEPMQKFLMYGMGLAALGLPTIFALLLSPISLLNLALLKLTGKGMLGWLIEGFKKLGGVAKDVGKKLKPVFKPIGDFLKKYAPKGSGGIFARIFGKVAGKGILAFLGPVGLVIGILWVLWDVVKYLWDNVKPFRDFMTGLWDGIVSAWDASIDWIVNSAVPWVVDGFQSIWDGIKKVGEAIKNFYNEWIKPVVDDIIWVVKVVVVTIGTIMILIGKAFQFIWNEVLKPFLSWIWDGLVAGLSWAWEAIKAGVKWLVDGVLWLWDGLKTGLQLAADGIVWVWDGLRLAAEALWNGIKWVVDKIVGGFWWVVDGVTAALGWIKDYVITPVVNWFMMWVWPVIQRVIQWIVGAFHWLRDKVTAAFSWIKNTAVKPVTDWFTTYVWPVIRNVLNWLKDKFYWVRDRIGDAWNWIKDKISNVYNDSIAPIFSKFGEAVAALKDSFNVAKDAIGAAWDEIKNRAKKPIAFVIDKVYNEGILPVWNKLAKAVDLDTRLTTVDWAENGYDTGGYTGPGSKYQPAGVVHADEFVVRKESQKSLRRDAPGLLDALNRDGSKALGYDGGGWVKPFKGNYGVNSTYGMRGGRMHSGVDYPLPRGTALTAVSDGQIVQRGSNAAAGKKISMSTDMRGIVAGYHHLSKYVSNLGDTVSKGQVIARSGNTGRSSGPHLHFSIKKDGVYTSPMPYLKGTGAEGAGGGGFSWRMPSIPNPFDGMLGPLLSRLPGEGGFKDIASKATTAMVSGAKSFAAERIAASGDWLQNTASSAASAGASVGRGAGTTIRWGTTARRALKHTGNYSAGNLHALLRRMNQESGGNPRAINLTDSNARRGTPSKGLMQVIAPTFRAYRDKSLSNDIYDPMANIVASINYAKSRYGSLTSAYNRKGGYAKGGLVGPDASQMLVDHMRFMGGPVETWGNTLVGELGPEMFLPANGGPASILGLHGPEVIPFDREGSVLPHQAVAALSEYNEHRPDGSSSAESNENSYYDVKVTVGGGATELDVEGAVQRAIAKAERKKRERR